MTGVASFVVENCVMLPCVAHSCDVSWKSTVLGTVRRQAFARRVEHDSSRFDAFQSCTVPAPIMTDEAAQRIRDACDYSIKITMEMGRSGTGRSP